MGGFDISLGLGLGLGLGLSDDRSSCMRIHEYSSQKEEDDPSNKAYPSLTLGPSSDDANTTITAKTESDVSSFSNSFSIKRERDHFTSDEVEPEVENNNNIPSNGNPSSTRKKLRLTKEQSAVLENTFKEHSALHPKQKQELARKLNLETRQVEVWFQNRRARTKLKQTEVECEVLKKCYEKLTEENKKLQKELKELKSIKTTAEEPFYMQLPVASHTVCPSCKRISGGSGGEMSNNGSSTLPSLAQCPIIISIRSPNLLRLPS